MFCKHEWKLISETITKSKFEVALSNIENRNIVKFNLPWQLTDASRKHIQAFQCKKCGKFKRFVEDI
jgi:hypothetical protein